MTIEEQFEFLLNRLIDFSSVPRGEIKFTYADTEGTKFDNLILHSTLTKPTMLELEAELAKYEEELYQEEQKRIIEEAARQAELERVAALKARWMNVLKVIKVSNPLKYAMDHLEDEDQLIAYEADEVTRAAAEGKATQLETLYNDLIQDIYGQLFQVFGTTNDASAAAFVSTYEAMSKRPANYIDPELGLPDEASVTTYANEKLAAADAYGIYRLKRLNQYKIEKAAI